MRERKNLHLITFRGTPLAVDPTVDGKGLNNYRKICHYWADKGKPIPCWGLWQATRMTREQRMRLNRKPRSSKYPHIHPKIRKAWCDFKYIHGRCSIHDFYAWFTGKGPYPLKFL